MIHTPTGEIVELTPEHQAVADKARALVLALETARVAIEVTIEHGASV